MKRGFTLIELLVVIAIIGIFSAVVVGGISSVRNKAKKANALLEMRSLKKALVQLEWDTDVLIGGMPLNTCVRNEEYSFAPADPDCGGGLLCNNSQIIGTSTTYSYSGWGGPYVSEGALIDPWGNPYLFDYDITCGDGGNAIPSERCEGADGEVSGITTGGVDGDIFTYDDNEVIVFCDPNG